MATSRDAPANRITFFGSPAGLACFIGIIVALILTGTLAFFRLSSGNRFLSSTARESDFYRKLQDFDQRTDGQLSFEYTTAEDIHRLLEDLERSALGVETHLSVLKRRRNLARDGNQIFVEGYRAAAERIARQFPNSQPLAAIAVESIIWSVPNSSQFPLSGNTAAQLGRYAALLADSEYATLSLAAYLLSGSLGDVHSALNDSRALAVLAILKNLQQNFGIWEPYMVNGSILHLLQGNTPEALEMIAPLLDLPLAATANPQTRQALAFGAEVLYDFGDPLQSAALFARLTDDRSIARQADALYRAGQLDLARALWTLLISPDRDGRVPTDQAILINSLYNLGATSWNILQGGAYLERLLAIDSSHLFGLIKYSRMLDLAQALAFLEALRPQEPLVKLEELRRRREDWRIDRVIPETWLLINRNPKDEPLYIWADYYFELQRQHQEVDLLIHNAAINGISGNWIPLSRGLQAIREGRLDEAAHTLETIPPEAELWQVPANLGRIAEAKRDSGAALGYYDAALELVQSDSQAARLEVRRAYCLRALGRRRESRQALEKAQQLDGDNLAIRMELRRIENGDL